MWFLQKPSLGPHFKMSIAGVDSFENKIKAAQDELGIAHDDRINIHYSAQMEHE